MERVVMIWSLDHLVICCNNNKMATTHIQTMEKVCFENSRSFVDKLFLQNHYLILIDLPTLSMFSIFKE